MIIYADKLFIKNFIMTYLILSIVGEMLNLKYKKRNLIIGSMLASIVTVIAVIYEIESNIFIRTITISLMIIISFKEKLFQNFVIEITFILATTFLIGGVSNSNINNLYELVLYGSISVVALKKYNDYYKKKKWKTRNNYEIEFMIEGENIKLNAFLDTGNFLATNYKEEPVIIISKTVAEKIPIKSRNFLLNEKNKKLNFKILKNIRLIRYVVLNEESKVAYGLKVKDIKIKNENIEIVKDAVIMLSKNNIKESDAIIGINLLEGGIENGNTFNIKTKSKEIIC